MQLASWLVVCSFIVATRAQCLSKGVYCSEDCKAIKRCIGGSEIVLSVCDSSSVCNLRNFDCRSPDSRGSCVPNEDLNKPDNFTVICSHDAPMPHPTDCNKYYTCPEKKLMACPVGQSYSIETRACNNWNTENCHINNTMEECWTSQAGESFPLPKDNNIIQVCTYSHEDFRIAFIQCELGKVFSKEQEKCIPKEEGD